MSSISALLHLTFPRESNNFKARILHSHILVLFIFGFVVIQLLPKLVFTKETISPQTLGYANQISVQDVVTFTNQKRTEAGLSTLTTNGALSSAALAKGKDMLAKGYWAHVSPDGVEPWAFFKQVDYKYRYAGENLARDFSSAAAAVDAWMASPTHRDNMLSNKYKEIGIAVVEGPLNGKDATIIVQLFGTQAADRPIVPVAGAETTNTAVAQAPAKEKVPVVDEPAQPRVVWSSIPGDLVKTAASQVARYDVAKVLSLVFLAAMSLLFVIDAVVLWRRNMVRFSGRPLAHLSFLGMIIIIVLIIQSGQVL